MSDLEKAVQPTLFKDAHRWEKKEDKKGVQKQAPDQNKNLPENLGKAIRLPVPDFNDPNRKPTCLEIDFPIARIDELSQLEGNAGKPIYQMSKWWARRRSSVFRSMLIAAAAEAPGNPNEAAKRVWDHYYCNHQKAGSFKNLRVLDCFMGGGTTLVEGSRLGMQMTGIDLNPVAWFIVKNELACSDPGQVKALFDHIEAEVKPKIQPFYITSCPRGHKGRWIDVETGETVDIDPIELPPDERRRFRWQGPEIIYTFWAKHGTCQVKGCGHRTPIFQNPVIAQKQLSTYYIELTCPGCGRSFHAELGETRMAPGSKRIILDSEPSFTEMTQEFAQLLKDYEKGDWRETLERILKLKEMVNRETGLRCPRCDEFSGRHIENTLENHARPSTKVSQRNKKDFNILRKNVQMYLLIHPEWLKGASGFDGEKELGGWAGAPVKETAEWYDRRLKNLSFVEVRGNDLPEHIKLSDGTTINTNQGTVPKQAQFICGHCGKSQDRLDSTKAFKHTSPVSTYTLQCHCPDCESNGYNYSGRYFKTPDDKDIFLIINAEREWSIRKEDDLDGNWPRMKIQHSMRTHVKDPLPDHGYTHWWMFFNSRQLLVHSQLLKVITESQENDWPMDVSEQALGVFQQYLRNQNMFAIWNVTADKMEPFFSEGNYNPKNLTIENSIFGKLGRGNWISCSKKCFEAMHWARTAWERLITSTGNLSKSIIQNTGDPIVPVTELYCSSSTDLSYLGDQRFDLIITDPPFGNNLFYADLGDFFYVWLRIPLIKWYTELPEQEFFIPNRTPHSMETIDNSAEHPDNRADYEKSPFITKTLLKIIQQLSGDFSFQEKSPNPFYRPEPSSEFYRQTLTTSWAEAGRLLKPGGLMAFTFHHSEDEPWIDVLKALFEAGYLLVATYPIRSDETKGATAAFGSKKIEYDIIHVCRKRLDDPEPVSWARMRRWVKEEAKSLINLLEHTHGKELPESDLRVILRGKSLEFYSRHYGQVYMGDGQLLDVRDVLLGINLLLDDLLEDRSGELTIPIPDRAEPPSRLYLRIFRGRSVIPRDELHKTLRGTGFSQTDFEARGWVRDIGKKIYLIPIKERFQYYTAPGRNRRYIKSDLDQAHFLIGAAFTNSGVNIAKELELETIPIKKSTDEIIKWYAESGEVEEIRQAAKTASQLVDSWRNRQEPIQKSLFDRLEEND